MCEENKNETGSISWTDLTVDSAEEIRDFYKNVVGWEADPVDMGDYNDFVMKTPGSGSAIGGVCHARGGNAGLPAQWLMYINVEDIEKSIAECTRLGGKVVAELKEMSGHGRYCVIEDPAGAVSALFEPTKG